MSENYKQMKTIRIIFTTAFMVCCFNAKSANKVVKDTTICLRVEMDCMSCKQKIEKNIAFEKGVKALDVDFAKKTVTIKYHKEKNTPQQLKQSIENLKYKAEFIAE